MTRSYDIAVVGAGLAGRLMALGLDHAGFSVVQIDRSANRDAPDDGRTTALSYAAVRLFRRLGLWDSLEDKAEPITDILVSNGEPRDRFRQGGLTGGQLHFPSSLLGEGETGEPALGYIVENKDLHTAMAGALSSSKVTAMFCTEVEHFSGRTITFQDAKTLSTDLLVACDGRHSPLRAKMNMQILRWGYPQTGIIVNIAHEKPHNGVAHEVFYPDGPFAILPMRNNQSSLVWTERERAAASYLALSDSDFLEALRERVGDHLGAIEVVSERQSYPLSLMYAPKLIAQRFILAGDAAHGIHPIAGQGFNLGIKDVAALVDVLTEARGAGLDIGHGAVLENYDRWRRLDGTALSLGTDVLNRLFSNTWGPLKHARGLGLAAVQRIDPLRKVFMRLSGSDLGDLPRLMQRL
ncbi:MAG: UbiH/UbiF/VisC/COQ6 family ubiquinone biosynthesis hydroxylase [Pseudomonadota bacterium]